MDEKLGDLGGRAMERHVRIDGVVDESGHELRAEHIIEVSQTFDGVMETTERLQRQVLACGHVHQVGGYIARCDSCSEKTGHPVYVCGMCAVTVSTGEALCLRCSIVGPDGRRYSPAGLKQAMKMGLFDVPSSATSAPRTSRLARILQWW